MKLYKTILCILVCLLISVPVSADTLPTKDAAKELVEAVMNEISNGKTSDGLDLMQPYLVIPISEFNVMKNQLAMQAPMIEQRFGKTIGVELADIEEVGDSLMLIMYIQKFDKHLMRWLFYFYKPKDKWILNTFNTDDKIQLMFSKI